MILLVEVILIDKLVCAGKKNTVAGMGVKPADDLQVLEFRLQDFVNSLLCFVGELEGGTP